MNAESQAGEEGVHRVTPIFYRSKACGSGSQFWIRPSTITGSPSAAVPNIFTIGDIVGQPMLARDAQASGRQSAAHFVNPSLINRMNTPPAYADLPPFVLADALNTLESNWQLLTTLVPMVLNQIDADLPAIQAHVMAKNAIALGESAHRLKGSLGAIAARPAYSACSDLNQAARNGDFESCTSGLRHLEREIDRLRVCLQAWLVDNGKTSTERN